MLNLNGHGKPIARIVGGNYNGATVYINDMTQDKGIRELNLNKVGGSFVPLNNPHMNRSVHFISAISGAGKTTWIKNFLKNNKMSVKGVPKDIYLISPFKDDPSIDEIKPKRIKVDDIDENPLQMEDFANSILIMDDIDCFKKSIKDPLYELLRSILYGGRHYNTDIFMTSHSPCGLDLQPILNESHTITIFPHSSANRKLAYLTDNYCNIDRPELHKIKKTNSRWATIGRTHPPYVITDKHCWDCSAMDDDDYDDPNDISRHHKVDKVSNLEGKAKPKPKQKRKPQSGFG